MTYWTMFFILSAGILFQQFFNDSMNRKIYYFLIMVLSGILTFRYGQGTDYFSYKSIFNSIISSKASVFSSSIHTEFGFKIIVLLFNRLRFSFEFLIGIFALLSMLLTNKAISKFVSCKYSALSLLLLFPTIYLTYYSSVIRQGLVIALFLGIMLPALLKKSYLCYYLTCFFAISIHYASILLLFVPLISLFGRKEFIILFLSALLFLILSIIVDLWDVLYAKTGFYYFKFSELSVLGVLERLIMVFIIISLSKDIDSLPIEIQFFIKIYFVGYCVSLALGYIPLLSHRLTAPLKAIEILLIPMLLQIHYQTNESGTVKKGLPLIIIILILYCGVFVAKNINSYIVQQNYINTNIFNYPYISIFNKNQILRVLPGLIVR